MSSEVQRYITGIMMPVEMANPGPASISARQTVVVTYDDYAALEAENARLREERDSFQRVGIQAAEERDAARAQLAAIQGGMGDADKHKAQPEVAENTGSHAMATNQLQRQEQTVGRDVEGVAAPCEASLVNDIFAWATFDGEGSYVLRLFEENESYRDDFRRNNPRHHPDWVFPLYRNSITAAMAAEVERWKERCQYNADTAHDVAAERDALRAELAEVKGREAVGEVQLRTGGGISLLHVDLTQPLPPGTKLYTSPPASPDVEGLVKALEDCAVRLRLLIDSRRHKMLDVVAEEKARAALSAWRQAQV